MFDDIPRLERHVRHLDWLIIKLNEKNVKLKEKCKVKGFTK